MGLVKCRSTHNLNSYSAEIILQSKLFNMYLVSKKGQETLHQVHNTAGAKMGGWGWGWGVYSYISVLLEGTVCCIQGNVSRF